MSNPWKTKPPSNGDQNPKFLEAKTHQLNSVKKHIKNYESSSSDEDDDNETADNLLGKILQNYSSNGSSQAGRTETFIRDLFISGANTCLVCISRVKRDNPIWTCTNCFGTFHLLCIQRWSKDSVIQQKRRIEERTIIVTKAISWGCPKCRFEHAQDNIPQKYLCFCGKTENPRVDPFLVPHSCGEICKKDLQPACGHKCLLLCHPGPCPPCPVTIKANCYCESNESMRRCSNRGWGCNQVCNKQLTCLKHLCKDVCHFGNCKACPKKSIQKCLCGSKSQLRDCAEPIWRCEKVCGKVLNCQKHTCEVVCHSGNCQTCLRTKPRTCPCGKSEYVLPCTEDTPTCGATCDKLLECGQHFCNQRCHKDKCGLCLEMVTKSCRCGQHSKEVQCCKEYLCDSKCKILKDCEKHRCNRKCCDGNCPPCEKPCGTTLQCGNHKCQSVCHRGLCYPCQQTKEISCKCQTTKITVACGRKHRPKPPKCQKLCLARPECHHPKRVDNHKCHYGDCPPCKQVCNLQLQCGHFCAATCHSSVLIKIEAQKGSTPWELISDARVEKRNLPCPDCQVPVNVTCIGGHETIDLPCNRAKSTSCGRSCGRQLNCSNHLCQIMCHFVENAVGPVLAGTNCEQCHNPCKKPRPDGCTHYCPKPCHPDDCDPCKQMLRIKCHCGLTQPYVKCWEWLDEIKREELQSCGNQCPKNYDCGHRCKQNCHSGPCLDSNLCKKKVKVFCECRRLKKEISCDLVRSGAALVVCDDVCENKKKIESEKRALMEQDMRKEEEEKNKKELEMFEKKFEKKKRNDRRRLENEEEHSKVNLKLLISAAILVLIVSIGIYYCV